MLRTKAGIVLSLIWLYTLIWAVRRGLTSFGEDVRHEGLEAWLSVGTLAIPVVLIPAYLLACARRQQRPRVKRWLPWVGRMFYVSIILALCDVWTARNYPHGAWFSTRVWAYKDGGTERFVGFGYSLTYHRHMSVAVGPEVWFWFAPFTIAYHTGYVGLRWKQGE